MGFEQIATLFAGVLASYGCWRWLASVISKKWTLYLWPTLMLAFAWLMQWATSFPSQSNWLGPLTDVLLLLTFGINLPAAIIGNGVLSSMIGKPAWLQAATASAAVWLTWFAILCVWRRWYSQTPSISKAK